MERRGDSHGGKRDEEQVAATAKPKVSLTRFSAAETSSPHRRPKVSMVYKAGCPPDDASAPFPECKQTVATTTHDGKDPVEQTGAHRSEQGVLLGEPRFDEDLTRVVRDW